MEEGKDILSTSSTTSPGAIATEGNGGQGRRAGEKLLKCGFRRVLLMGNYEVAGEKTGSVKRIRLVMEFGVGFLRGCEKRDPRDAT